MRPFGPFSVTALLVTATLTLAGPVFVDRATGAASNATADIGELSLHATTIEFGQAPDPRLFTIGCGPDEQLVSGGHSGTSPLVEVAFSYPSTGDGRPALTGEEPRGWTVGVVNTTTAVQTMQIVAACLAGGDGRSTVRLASEPHSENQFALAAACPRGSVRTGGGFSSTWDRRLGAASVRGSYPLPDQGWGVDAAMLPADPDVHAQTTLSVHVVCHWGEVEVTESVPVAVRLTDREPACGGGNEFFAPTCVFTRSGSQSVTCGEDQILVGGGYRFASDLPTGSYSAIVNAPVDGPMWTVWVEESVSITAPAPQSLPAAEVVVTPLCLVAVTGGATPGQRGGQTDPVAGGGADGADERTLTLAVVAGIGLLALATLIALAALAIRRMRKPRIPQQREPLQPEPGVDVQIVVRAQRSAYRVDEFRERP